MAAGAVVFALVAPLSGCKSAYDRAVEKAKQDAIATGQAQQVVSVDKDGKTTVTVVQPPQAVGQPVSVNTQTEPAGAPLPANLPDYSNGARPAPGNTVTFMGPKTGVAAPASGEPLPPGSVVGSTPIAPAPTVAAPSVGPAVNGAVAGAGAGIGSGPDAPEAPPANFVPTNVTLPAGTGIAIRINQTLSVKHTHAGDRFSGSLAETIRRDGNVVLPRGTRFNGVVTEAHKRGHFKGRSYLGLRLTSMVFNGKVYPIETAGVTETKKGKGKRTAGFIGGTAGVGALVGGVATGGVGLAVGALAGGGLGTFLAGVTGNKDITIPAETLLRFRLEDNLTVQPAQ
ncbi:hypothetical protein [Terriglobus aquaticus]|uniref:Uncharacterized protein n=1 Tax=Terriglobus aquaticus TaxID=940139 RepID=A0ABW9KMF9_9BACT